MKDKKKFLWLIPVAMILGLVIWNLTLQAELTKYKPQVEAYLPEDM